MSAFAAIIGTSTVVRHVQHLVVKVAELSTPVMIYGEPGSGKELVARAIHEKSARASEPFIPVKCAAMTEDVLEAELFGVVSNNTYRQGRFDVASGGTIFLDEINKLSPRLQSSILKALTEGTITPVGGTNKIPTNARLMCASIYPLEQLVRERIIKEDLYYRLASCSVYIPPLRERREDIPHLVNFFIDKFNHQKGKNILGASPDAMTALLQHDWMNNIRELENFIERIVILKNSGHVEVCDLPPRLRNFVTDNIDDFYERTKPSVARASESNRQNTNNTGSSNNNNSNNSRPTNGAYMGNNHGNAVNHSSHNHDHYNNSNNKSNQTTPTISTTPYTSQNHVNNYSSTSHIPLYEETSDIDQFIKKEIDLGNGIDFYRLVEEFENRLIAEALRRTNHNKNRAAQLLSMNRTTLVEKLKKRTTTTSSNKIDQQRVKRNSAFTIFDSLGSNDVPFANEEYMIKEDTTGILEID